MDIGFNKYYFILYLGLLIALPILAQDLSPELICADELDNDPANDDIDDDDDGLIELCYLEDVNAIREDVSGTSLKRGASILTAGCPTNGCVGYELVRDLDFATTRSYVNAIANKKVWTVQNFDDTDDFGWLPIGDADNPFNTVFEGGGHTIFGLEMNREVEYSGLFGVSNVNSIIRNFGVVGNFEISGLSSFYIACLVGENRGQILNSHATCRIKSSDSDFGNLGGLVGTNQGQISSSYVLGLNPPVDCFEGDGVHLCSSGEVGGLVADNRGQISNSYAIADIRTDGFFGGGLVAYNSGTITDSYAIADIATVLENKSGLGGIAGSNEGTIANSYVAGSSLALVGLFSSGNTSGYASIDTSVLQVPTAPDATDPDRYTNWSTDNWDFGDTMSYPALRYIAGDAGNACALLPHPMQPRCGALLPGQPGRNRGLNTLFFARNGLEWGVTEIPVAPPFSSLLYDYGVTILYSNTLQLRPYAAIGTATISITKVGDTANRNYFSNKRSGDLSEEILLPDENVPTTLTVVVIDADPTTYHFVIRRTVPDEAITLDITTPDSGSSVHEGDPITAQVGDGNSFYYYALFQDEVELMRGESTASVLSFRIPEDLDFEADATTRKIVYTVSVDNGSNKVDKNIELIVAKRNNGEPQLDLNIIGSQFGINPIVDDPDGVGRFTYRWQRRDEGDSDWIDVSDNYSYTAPVDGPNTIRYRVIINHVDGQEYSETYSIGPFPYLSDADNDPDDDPDKLIDIYYLEDLNAIRYGLDGSDYSVNHPSNINVYRNFTGCSDGCIGYELLRDLDFNTTQSYIDAATARDQWTVDDFSNASDTGWLAIGSVDNPFDSTFDGNNYKISNLQINRDTVNDADIALFAAVSGNASIKHVGLSDVAIEGRGDTSSLVAENKGAVVNSYAYGRVIGGQDNLGGLVAINDRDTSTTATIVNSYANVIATSADVLSAGGLVGSNRSVIRNSYAVANVNGPCNVGGLVGENKSKANGRGQIINSYAAGDVGSMGNCIVDSVQHRLGGLTAYNEGLIKNSYAYGSVSGYDGSVVGGLVAASMDVDGALPAEVESSYWDSNASERTRSAGGTSKTTVQLQMPTAATGIYADWNTADWDFGTSVQYPIVKYTSATDIFAEPVCATDADNALPPCGTIVPNQRIGLQSLTLSIESRSTPLMPPFNPAITSYRIAGIVNAINHTTISATALESTSRIRIKSSSLEDDIETNAVEPTSDVIPLEEGGTTTITIIVTTEDSEIERAYTVAIERLPSSDAGLAELEIAGERGNIKLTPEFSTTETEYTGEVQGDVEVWINTTATHSKATIQIAKVGSQPIPSMRGQARKRIELDRATTTTVMITVTAQDRVKDEIYTVKLRRLKSSDANLRSLEIVGIDGRKFELTRISAIKYSAEVKSDQSISIHAAAHPRAMIEVIKDRNSVAGKKLMQGRIESDPIELNQDTTTTIVVRVISEAGNRQDTTLVISHIIDAIRIRVKVFLEGILQ